MMETITYDQVQQIVIRIPARKLPLAYSLLQALVQSETAPLSPQQQFLHLPFAERRRIMMQQAEQLQAHYQQAASEREAWQTGDFSDAD